MSLEPCTARGDTMIVTVSTVFVVVCLTLSDLFYAIVVARHVAAVRACVESDGDSYFSSISSVRDSCCISV